MLSEKYMSKIQSYFVVALLEEIEEIFLSFFLFCYVLNFFHVVVEMPASLDFAWSLLVKG